MFIIWLFFATIVVVIMLAIPSPPLVSFQFDLGLVLITQSVDPAQTVKC